ncbi:MAG: hypothetical protein P0Y66_03805 [Candidatus Kaistia colombiensis]|nr:MAG: hypothetical protein P0Y66_03805 [Kaistia sp.]
MTTKTFEFTSTNRAEKIVTQGCKPDTKQFEDWLTKVVLPSIRKDGAYFAGEEKVTKAEMSEDELILKAMSILQRKVERLALLKSERSVR